MGERDDRAKSEIYGKGSGFRRPGGREAEEGEGEEREEEEEEEDMAGEEMFFAHNKSKSNRMKPKIQSK